MTTSQTLKRVLIMTGGTGGHVFPGLALAKYLQEQGIEVHWLGTKKGLEARLVSEANIPLHFIRIGGVRGKGVKTKLAAPFRIGQATWQAKRIIKAINPDVVIGMGGFVSGPGGIASWLLGYPLIIHEQNAKAGMTNKILGKIARRILEGFPQAFKPDTSVIVTGNPIRGEIAQLPPPREELAAMKAPLKLLVLGGSLGASALNAVLPQALSQLKLNERPEVRHQTGDKHLQVTKAAYEHVGVSADLTPFISNMAEAYTWADMVICRAGALTVAELCAAGRGAVFVPFPHAVDDHQTANANFMVKHDAALCVQQTELTAERLATILADFVHQRERCLAMAKAAYQLRQVDVAEKIYKICQEVRVELDV